VDIETRRKKQQDLMIRMVERKVRERAQQLYEERGQADGEALADWVQAESEILEGTMAASLYRRAKASAETSERGVNGDSDLTAIQDSEAVCEPV
jgi:Protein of unknown function (DUF2934)